MFCSRSAVALATVLGWSALFAAPVTSPVKGAASATSKVANSCTIINATAMSFGAYDPTSGTAALGSGQIQLRCTKNAAFAIASNGGQHNSAMQGPTGGLLAYSLFQDAGLSKPFGAGGTDYLTTLPVGKYACFSASGLVSSATDYTIQQNNAYYASQGQVPLNALATVSGRQNIFYGYVNSVASPSQCQYSFNAVLVTASNVLYGQAVSTATPFPSSATFYVPTKSQAITGTSTSALSVLTIPFYGKVPARQDLAPGQFTDTVTFTVSF
jgi:spore coat protein U-like protein